MIRIDFEKLEIRSDQSYWFSDSPFTGIAVFRRGDGSIESEVEFSDGVQQGFFRDLDLNGQVLQEGTIRNGVYQGDLISYGADGVVRKLESYDSGVCKSIKEWSKTGELKREESLPSEDWKTGLLEMFKASGTTPAQD